MELKEAIRIRRSVRTFKKDPVSRELLYDLITECQKGPSAGAIRGWHFYVTDQKLVYDAPLYIVICVNEEPYEKRYGERGKTLYAIQDAAIAGAYLGLLLVEQGLSSVWVGAFKEDKIKRLLGTELRPVAILAVGYACE